jgi:hypothetical protein
MLQGVGKRLLSAAAAAHLHPQLLLLPQLQLSQSCLKAKQLAQQLVLLLLLLQGCLIAGAAEALAVQLNVQHLPLQPLRQPRLQCASKQQQRQLTKLLADSWQPHVNNCST